MLCWWVSALPYAYMPQVLKMVEEVYCCTVLVSVKRHVAAVIYTLYPLLNYSVVGGKVCNPELYLGERSVSWHNPGKLIRHVMGMKCNICEK